MNFLVHTWYKIQQSKCTSHYLFKCIMRSRKNRKWFFCEMGRSNSVPMQITQTNIAKYCIRIRKNGKNQLTKLWQSQQEPSHHTLMAYPILMLEPMRTRNPNILLTLSLVEYWNPYNNALWSINPPSCTIQFKKL